MKREIKFRAWSNESEKMMSWEFIKSYGTLNKLLTLNHITIMQYTGLKDKNGKEIYELNEINNKFRVVFKFNRYILQSISNSDIFEEIKENGKYEITGEYSPIP